MIVRTACPFCGGAIVVDEDEASIAHALPACAEFTRNGDSLDFLIRVNAKLRAERMKGGSS